MKCSLLGNIKNVCVKEIGTNIGKLCSTHKTCKMTNSECVLVFTGYTLFGAGVQEWIKPVSELFEMIISCFCQYKTMPGFLDVILKWM